MSEHVENAVLSALSADAAEFKNNIFAALNQKITDALAAKKVEVAQSFFGQKQENNSEDEEETDEKF